MSSPIISARSLGKSFATTSGDLSILHDVSFAVFPGEKIAIIGPSGSGKSTLLSLLGLLDVPTVGELEIVGAAVSTLSEKAQAKLRNEKIGFIFQSFELITPFTVGENIAAPLEIGGQTLAPAALDKVLQDLRLSDRRDAMPPTLSGGEKQRVAIARAVMHNPALLLADEPTGSLDRQTGERVLDLLLAAVSERGTALIVITHDESIAARMDRVFAIKDGTLYER